MRIILKFDDKKSDFFARFRPGTNDLCITVRPNPETAKLEIVSTYPKLSAEAMRALLQKEDKINLEIIGHSGRGGKTLQSEKTAKYPVATIGVDAVIEWIESFLTEKQMPKSTISLLTCEAAAHTKYFASIAEQMLHLFEIKPLKVTAREGFVYIEKELHSLGVLMTAAQQMGLVEKRDKSTSSGEKFAFYYDMSSDAYYKVDKQLFDLFRFLKNSETTDKTIQDITAKKLETVSKKEFSKLVAYALEHYKESAESKIFKKAKIIKAGGIYPPEKLTGHIDSFKQKEGIEFGINYLLGLLKANDADTKNIKEIEQILSKLKEFVSYRQLRNYEIDEFYKVRDMIGNVIVNQGGVFKPSDIKVLADLKNKYESSVKILKDTATRSSARTIRLPSFYKDVYNVTDKKNTEFSNFISKMVDALSLSEKRDVEVDIEMKPTVLFHFTPEKETEKKIEGATLEPANSHQFLNTVVPRYIEAMRDATPGRCLFGGDIEIDQFATKNNVRIRIHQANQEMILIGNTQAKEIIDIRRHHNHYDVCNDKGEIIFKIAPEGNCLFNALLNANLKLIDPTYEYRNSTNEGLIALRNEICDAMLQDYHDRLEGKEVFQEGFRGGMIKLKIEDDPIYIRFQSVLSADKPEHLNEALDALPVSDLRREAEALAGAKEGKPRYGR